MSTTLIVKVMWDVLIVLADIVLAFLLRLVGLVIPYINIRFYRITVQL